ncbi:TPA: PIN domain-containing protein [Candidatus Bathyarchaeota archaeon]|nr:PIN domain-containing protein [Candidatus Bathyarchaeota archaeon]
MNNFKIVPVTFEIADLAAKLRARRGGKLPDALIAATAIDQAADLLYSQDEPGKILARTLKFLG